MKIKKQATARHAMTISPMIAEFVQATASIPLYQMPAHLASFPKLWPFPRGDTYHWIPVLNRFDRILELFNKEYGLVDGPQTEPFRRRLLLKGDAEEGEAPQEQATDDILDKLHMDADADRVLIEQIVDFTRLLIENCGNRALYASSAHLEKLLNSTSTSLIRATLRLTLRLAQRYHAARMRTAHTTLHPALLQNHYDISLDKVKELAAPLPRGPTTAAPLFATPAGKGKDKAYGDRRGDSEKVNSSDLISLFALSETTLKQEFGGVSISYYDPSASSEEGTAPHASSESPATPTPARRTLNLQPHQTPRQPHPLANADSPATPVTPAFGGDGEGGRASGPKTFELSSEAVSTTDLYDLFRQGSNVLPQGPKSDFFNRLRSAKALHQGRSGLEDLVAIRLLAIANLGYVLGEKDFHTKIGQPDSDEPRRLQLAYQLAELVHPPGSGTTGVSQDLQTVALGTLEALARHKSKAPDVCAALSVNVNHGVLFYVVRKAVAELGKPEKNEDESEEDWREALYSLLNTLPTSQARAGEGMVSAGLLEILIEVLTLRTPQAERSYPKILNFLDTFVYNLRDAFSSIVSAKGLEILADLTSHEVDTSKKLAEEGKGMPAEYKTHYTDYKIPFYNQQNLRWLFKFLNHMLSHNSGGATDRLMRNLIDSPQLLGALKTVLLNPVVFGSTVWSLAVNILTSFIHNEPTSYQVIAEAGLSEAFLETVAQQPVGEQTKATDDTPKAPLETGILPHADAISTLPTAFGAICLAEAGMKLFKSSPALARFFEIFESPAHVKALDVDSDIANLIGSNVDELVRHHPPLKDDVMTCISNMIQRVVLLCSNKAAKDGVGAKLWTESEDGTMFVAGGRQALSGPGVTGRKETHATAGENKEDIEMADADAPAPNASSDSTVTLSEVVETEDSADGPTTAQYIRTVFRFLHGFFGHQHNCSAFIDAVGIESILDLGTLPCLSPHLAKPNEARGTSEDFGRVVQQLVEEKPHIATPAIVKRAQENLDRLEPLMRHTRKTAFFAPFTSFSPSEMQNSSEHRETLQRGTDYVKSLVNVHTLVQSLTVTFQGSMYNHRASNSITAQVNLADMYARLVHSLGLLNRSCVWEEILLQKNMPAEWEKETRISRSQLESVAESFGIDIMADNEPAAPAEPTDVSVVDGPDAATSNQNTSSNQESAAVSLKSARFKNTRTLRYLLSKVPTTIAPFFHALGKLLLFRRSLEPYQKQCAILVADQLAQAAIDQFEFEGPRESDLVQEKYAYWILSLDSMSQLMVDSHSLDRVTHALTLILVSFRNLGGLTVLADVLSSFYESAVAVVKTPRDDMKQDTRRLLNLALGGIRSVLDFYVHIITSKVINESAQTTTLQSRPDRGRESADYFLAAQFVVELRHAVIKPVQKIWNSELMDNATTSIVKTSISILKTVLDGDTEFGAYQRLDQIPKRNKPTIKPWKPRSGDYIQRLKDLGFDEGLAKEALYRCCDNFNAAREYCENQNRIASRNPPPSYENELKTTPTAEAETGDNATDDASDAGSDESHNSDGSDGEDDPLADMEGTDDAPENVDTGTQSPVADVTDPNDASWDLLAYRRRMRVGNLAEPVALDELDKERAALRTNLIDRSLDILNSHDDVTFELADLILAAVAKASDSATMRADIGSTLVQSLISLETGDDFREHGKKIAASAHLLALVIQDKDFYEAVVGELQDSFMMLLEFIKIFPDHPPEQSSPWVGQVLVIVERLLAEDQLPAQIEWTPPTGDEEAVSVEDMPTPVVPLDEKMQLLEAILDVLPRIGKDESLALSVTRVLVMLTRVREIAAELAKKRNIQRLFLMIRQLSGITNDGLRSAFMIVLRHIIEDETIIRQIMRTDIQTMFEQRERRQTDTTAYTRQMHYLAIRDPRIFVEVTNEKLQLARFDANQRPQNLILKKEELDTPASEDTASSGATDEKPKDSTELRKAPPLERTKTSELKPPVVENPDGVIHYLLCELLAYKEVEDNAEISKTVENANLTAKEDTSSTTPEAPSDQTIPASDLAKPEKVEFKAEAHPIYIYRCFILKCLAELLQSYNRTKVEFINFSRKADPHASTPSKPRSGVLNYLLSALVPVGTLSHEGDLTFKKKSATSSCAIDVIVSLCAKTGEHKQPPGQASPYTESEPDLLFVRKFVLEHALKAFKDASVSDEALDMKYSRLLSISDIFSKMVSQRSDGQMLSPTAELTPPLKQMAKIMYEKNFITVLTTAIADIDLNFPNAKRAVKYILKPLKWLSTVAVDLSTHYDTSASPGSMDEYEISSASDDDMVGATREETPDLFRNSTLGMYEPPHESDDEDEDEEGDEEMYDEVFGDEMEYEEDMDDEDVVSDEDEEMGDMGPIEGLPGDVDVEVVIDDDDDEPISGEDDDSEEDEDEDDDEDDEEEDDEDDDMDDMDDMDEIDEMEEITGDDENASLVDDGEGSWSGDNGFIGGDIDLARGNIPPGLVFGLEQPQQMHDAIALRNMDDLDDYMEEEEEEEDEEEDYDEEEIVYHAGHDDDDDGLDMGWDWDGAPPPGMRIGHARLSPWMFPGGPGDRIVVPAYRSHRPGLGPRNPDDGVNPLLQRVGRPSGRGVDSPLPATLRNEGSDWVHALGGRGHRTFAADSPVSFISTLLNAMSQGAAVHQHNGAVHLSFNTPAGLPPPFDPSFRRDTRPSRETASSRSTREDPYAAVAFHKSSTGIRWQEEARILYGSAAADKAARVINSILKVLVPPAIEAAKKRQAEKEAEAARKLKEEQERKEQKEREEREAREAKEREEREQREREEAEREAQRLVENQEAAEEGDTTTETAIPGEAHDMEGVEEEAQASAEQHAEAGASDATPRTTNIGGREIDIGALGIDLEYLEALPEELREEVLVQQITEQRQRNQESQAGAAPSNIDPEFLEALPPNIRAEVLQQEAQERRRREREEARRRSQTAGAPRVGEDMDAANFLASLDPGFRQVVLLEQDDDVLNQLPAEIAAEARAYGGDRRLSHVPDYGSRYRRGDPSAPQDDPSHKKKARPCVQMLDKSGVATLLRLMFIPQQGSAKVTLSHILRNVCENRQNRAEVISILLSILQDGSADVNAVERSFAQLSIRAKQPQSASEKTPKFSRKNTALSINSDVSPMMVVQQCLHTLWQLTDKNPHVWSFFLTEHETAVGFKNRGNRKGKTKETKAMRYPLNALLGLLDRKLIIESSTIMEQLTLLLRVITTPLQVLKKEKEKEEPTKTPTSTEEGQSSGAQPSATEQGQAVQDDSLFVAEGEDTDMASAPEASAAEGSAPKTEDKQTEDDKAKKHRTLVPPEVPESNLRLVAKILAARECNGKVFQETLSIINNLSPIPGAKETFGKELLAIAQDLAQATLSDLATLTEQVSKAASSTDVQGMALAKFSPASSDQTKLLRALTALDYLFNPTSRDSKDKDEKDAGLEPAQKEDILLSLYESSTFAGLWQKLSECLSVIRQRGNMLNIATILLPLIEALMVVCKNTTSKDAPVGKLKEFTLSSPPPENKMESLFFTFTEDHRKILNDLVRQNPKLMSGTFSLLVKNSKVLEFDNKRNYFSRKLHTRSTAADRHPHPPLQLAVRRDQVFLDSFKSLYFKGADEMKYGKLNIRFHGEEGVDAGGVTREWFQVIARQMFNPDYALFVPVASDRTTFHPNRLSSINPEHLMFFKFIGRVIGKALYEGRVLDCHFSRAVYKRILGRPVNLKDMETLDLEYYNSLQWMLNNDITDVITETFSVDVEAFGEVQTVDLIENGRNVPVTEENKHDYVRLVTEHRLTGSVHEQLEHFLKGFHDIVPAELVAIFSEQELELLISGLPDINVDDWKNNTEYHNYTAASPQIQWFWRAVRSFDKEERAKLLQFVTGTSKVPLNGFKELEGMNGFSRFNIHRDFQSKDRLPSSHTCFNQLDLPEYESYEDLRKQLYTAMTAGGEYFGFA